MEQLKKIREAKGISQKEFANALGVTESAVSHWESGRYLPTAGKLQKMVDILGCTFDELLTDPREKLEAELQSKIDSGETTADEAEDEYQNRYNPEPRYCGQEW